MAVAQDKVIKYPKTPHLPFSPGVQSDDVVITSEHLGSLHFLKQEAILTEKLDGGNCSIYRGKVYARTVNSEATHASFGPIKQLAAECSYAIPSDIQLFGENMFGVHSIEYDQLDSFFYLFGALKECSHWLPWDHVTELANEISVPTVPVAATRTFDDMHQIEQQIATAMKLHSKCGSCHPEGFVVRMAGGFPLSTFDCHVAKYVRAGHIQTDESWRRTWKQAKLNKK